MKQRQRVTRRRLLQASLLGGALAGCATAPRGSTVAALVPIRAQTERIMDISVCVRPFRPAGPRVDAERVGDTLVVHNYGHGGSGWSLSWGSSARAVQMAMAASPGEVAVIGCGALGLTSAILAQRAGARVTIYAREQLPQTRSARATGEWTPDSRIALAHVAAPGFADVWEDMARTAFKTHCDYLGQPGNPVEWIDQYAVSNELPSGSRAAAGQQGPDFVSYGQRIRDLTPRWQRLSADAAPFEAAAVSRTEIMMFNISEYAHTLLTNFFAASGRFQQAEFQAPAQIAELGKKVVINCTGYGARALWKDEMLIPVRGQIAHLIPQPDVHYGVVYRQVLAVPRRDGIVVQSFEGGEEQGYGDGSETPDREESERAVTTLAQLFAPPYWRGGSQVA
jgi:glycine/D-amino acid oxidase-like deaminating enzyme